MKMQRVTAALIVSSFLAGGYQPLALAQAMSEEDVTNTSSLDMNSPGSIVDRLEEDAAPKDYVFQFPGVSGVLQPWYDMKADLEKNHGFKYGISYTTFYPKANDTFGPEDDAASYDLDIAGSWTFFARETTSPAMLGFDVFRRDTLGTEIPPQRLFTQYRGALLWRSTLRRGGPGRG